MDGAAQAPGAPPGRHFAVPADLAARGISTRPEEPADRDFLCRLYVSVRWPEVAPLADWSEDAKVAFLRSQFEYQDRSYKTNHPGGDFRVIMDGETAIGRLYLLDGPANLHIMDITFLPEWRGRGLGTALLTGLQDLGRATGRRVTINVEQFNPARTLYGRLGFVEQPGEANSVYIAMAFS